MFSSRIIVLAAGLASTLLLSACADCSRESTLLLSACAGCSRMTSQQGMLLEAAVENIVPPTAIPVQTGDSGVQLWFLPGREMLLRTSKRLVGQPESGISVHWLARKSGDGMTAYLFSSMPVMDYGHGNNVISLFSELKK